MEQFTQKYPYNQVFENNADSHFHIKIGGTIYDVSGLVINGSRLGNCRNNLIRNVVVEASIQEALGNIKNLAVGNSGLLNLGRKKYTEVKHYLEQQIFRRSVLFYVVCIVIKQALLNFVRLIVNLFHI